VSEAIALRGVTKTFGDKVAVRDLDLDVPEGALYGLIGPNGAGKTTSIRMMMSILFPDRGEVRVLGHASALEAKDRIGYLPEERGVYKKMKVGDFLAYMARLKGCSGHGLPRLVHQWLERVALPGVENKRCEELSKGMQQKVQLVAAVIHEPQLLILDEPFSGLDPVNMRLLRDLVLEQHRRGTTILFSTHVMVQAEQLCDHIVMIHDGRKVLDGTLAQIRSTHDPRTLWFEALDPQADVRRLAELDGIAAVERSAAAWEITLAEAAEPGAVMRRVVETMAPARLELHRPTLEDIFVQIVAGGGGGSEQERARLRAALEPDAAPQGSRA
jgi:ABC-2 type transport system ATP-binding protein